MSGLTICEHYNNGHCLKYDEGCFNQCVQKQVSEDAISRTEFIEIIKGTITDATSHGISPRLDPHFVISMVKSAPSVIPKAKEGEWIYIDEPIIGNPYGRYRCSECELDEPHETPYCPNCGSRNLKESK